MWGQAASAKHAEQIAREMTIKKKKKKKFLADFLDNRLVVSLSSSSQSMPPCLMGCGESSNAESYSFDKVASLCKASLPIFPCFKANEFLKDPQETVKVKSSHIDQLDELISENETLAKARCVNDNQIVAMLSMKKVFQLQCECQCTLLAINEGSDTALDIEDAIDPKKPWPCLNTDHRISRSLCGTR